MSSNNKIDVIPVLLTRRGDDNLHADGSALPMSCLTSYIKHDKNSKLSEHFFIHKLIQRKKKDWGYYSQLANDYKDGAIWLFSCYAWNTKDNLMIAQAVKSASPASLIIVGGPHIPGYPAESEDFFALHPYIDIAVRGEGEITLASILECIVENKKLLHNDYASVSGLIFRDDNKIIRTADRVRTKDISVFPSPYLTGELDDESFNDQPGLILETNRGCPYGCTFCDWGSATLQKVRHIELERIKKEIDYIGRKKAISIHIADANFGAFERDIDIAKAVVATNKKYGHPKQFNCSYAKNASPRLAKIIKILTEGGLLSEGIISLQTSDRVTLEAINRENIKNEKYEQLIDIFKAENLPLTSELLIGLPGQTFESHKKDLQFFVDRKLTMIVYPVQIMPNAPMNDPAYRERYKIKTNKDGFVIATSSFDEQDYYAMNKLFLAVQFYYMLGVLKYFLYYLQVEKNIKALDFIAALLDIPKEKNDSYPLSAGINTKLLPGVDERYIGILKLIWVTEDAEFIFNHLDDYYSEIFRFAKDNFGVELTDTEQETLLLVQKGVMPALGKKVPQCIDLPHDFVAYFDQIKYARTISEPIDDFRPLQNFARGQLEVSALHPKTIDNLTLLISNMRTSAGWELRSALRFVKPRVFKKQKAG